MALGLAEETLNRLEKGGDPTLGDIRTQLTQKQNEDLKALVQKELKVGGDQESALPIGNFYLKGTTPGFTGGQAGDLTTVTLRTSLAAKGINPDSVPGVVNSISREAWLASGIGPSENREPRKRDSIIRGDRSDIASGKADPEDDYSISEAMSLQHELPDPNANPDPINPTKAGLEHTKKQLTIFSTADSQEETVGNSPLAVQTNGQESTLAVGPEKQQSMRLANGSIAILTSAPPTEVKYPLTPRELFAQQLSEADKSVGIERYRESIELEEVTQLTADTQEIRKDAPEKVATEAMSSAAYSELGRQALEQRLELPTHETSSMTWTQRQGTAPAQQLELPVDHSRISQDPDGKKAFAHEGAPISIPLDERVAITAGPAKPEIPASAPQQSSIPLQNEAQLMNKVGHASQEYSRQLGAAELNVEPIQQPSEHSPEIQPLTPGTVGDLLAKNGVSSEVRSLTQVQSPDKPPTALEYDEFEDSLATSSLQNQPRQPEPTNARVSFTRSHKPVASSNA